MADLLASIAGNALVALLIIAVLPAIYIITVVLASLFSSKLFIRISELFVAIMFAFIFFFIFPQPMGWIFGIIILLVGIAGALDYFNIIKDKFKLCIFGSVDPNICNYTCFILIIFLLMLPLAAVGVVIGVIILIVILVVVAVLGLAVAPEIAAGAGAAGGAAEAGTVATRAAPAAAEALPGAEAEGGVAMRNIAGAAPRAAAPEAATAAEETTAVEEVEVAEEEAGAPEQMAGKAPPSGRPIADIKKDIEDEKREIEYAESAIKRNQRDKELRERAGKPTPLQEEGLQEANDRKKLAEEKIAKLQAELKAAGVEEKEARAGGAGMPGGGKPTAAGEGLLGDLKKLGGIFGGGGETPGHEKKSSSTLATCCIIIAVIYCKLQRRR